MTTSPNLEPGLESGRATTYDSATTSGYAALATGTSATVSLQCNPVTINSSDQGAGVTLGTVKQFDFAAARDPATLALTATGLAAATGLVIRRGRRTRGI